MGQWPRGRSTPELQREHPRYRADDCLGDSSFCAGLCGRQGLSHTSGCVNFVFTRVSFARRLGPSLAKGQPSSEGTVECPACGDTFRFGDPQRSLLRQQRTPPLSGVCGRHSLRACHIGEGLRAGRESSDSGESLATRNVELGRAPQQPAFGQSASDATTRSITVTSVTVRLLGR